MWNHAVRLDRAVAVHFEARVTMFRLLHELLAAELLKRGLVLLHLNESPFVFALRLGLNFYVRIRKEGTAVVIEVFLARDDQVVGRGCVELATLLA